MANFNLFSKRLTSLSFALLLLIGAIVVQLVHVQLISANGYAARAQSELMQSQIIMAPRGSITDKNGVAFARSVDS